MGTNVSGIGAKLDMKGVNFGTKSMTNIMQSKEAWAQNILKADRAEPVNAKILNFRNDPRARDGRGRNISAGQGNVYGALQNGLALQPPGWGSRDDTVTKVMTQWVQNLAAHPTFKARGEYTPDLLAQIASDAKKAACTLRDNMKELCAEAEVSQGDINYWNSVADGLADYADKILDLRHAVCQKQDPAITKVTLDIPARKH